MYPELNPNAHIAAMQDRGVGGAVSLNFDPSEDQALGVSFFIDQIHNAAKSKEAGRPIFDDVDMCEIRMPGSQDRIRNVVSEKEMRRFPRQYAAFKAGQDQDAASGTPLVQWPLMSRALCEEARHFGVRTVEALSEIPDSGLQRLGAGWLDLRKKARDWLIKAKDGAFVAKLRSENDELRARLETCERMLAQQAIAIQAGGVAPAAAPVVDNRIEQMQAQLAKLLAGQGPVAAAPPAPVINPDDFKPAKKKPGPKPKVTNGDNE